MGVRNFKTLEEMSLCMTSFADWEKYRFVILMILINRKSCLHWGAAFECHSFVLGRRFMHLPGEHVLTASQIQIMDCRICHVLYAWSSLVLLRAMLAFHRWINPGSGSFSDSPKFPQVSAGCAGTELSSWLCYSGCSSGTTWPSAFSILYTEQGSLRGSLWPSPAHDGALWFHDLKTSQHS